MRAAGVDDAPRAHRGLLRGEAREGQHEGDNNREVAAGDGA